MEGKEEIVPDYFAAHRGAVSLNSELPPALSPWQWPISAKNRRVEPSAPPLSTYVTGNVVGGFSGRFIASLCVSNYDCRLHRHRCHHPCWQPRHMVVAPALDEIRQPDRHGGVPRLSPPALEKPATPGNLCHRLQCPVLPGRRVHLHQFLSGRQTLSAQPGRPRDHLRRVSDRRSHNADFGCHPRQDRLPPDTGNRCRHDNRRHASHLDQVAATSTGVFACQAAASSYVGKAAGTARSSAAGLYVALYYGGGCFGSILPGLFWSEAGWFGCVALILCLQVVILILADISWKD